MRERELGGICSMSSQEQSRNFLRVESRGRASARQNCGSQSFWEQITRTAYFTVLNQIKLISACNTNGEIIMGQLGPVLFFVDLPFNGLLMPAPSHQVNRLISPLWSVFLCGSIHYQLLASFNWKMLYLSFAYFL